MDNDTVAVGNNVNASGDTSNDGVLRGPGQAVTGADHNGTRDGTGHGPATPVTPPPAAPPPVDYSSHAQLICEEDSVRDEFPEAAVQAGVTGEEVRVRVTIEPDGHVSRAVAANNPGYGFAAAAERVARNSACRTVPARDHAGNVVADTISFRITFRLD
jgi:TonB family protein